MAKFGTFKFGTDEKFGTADAGGGTGPLGDYLVVANIAAARETLFTTERIEVHTGSGWDTVIAAEWIEAAPSNAKRDDRPAPHPDW